MVGEQYMIQDEGVKNIPLWHTDCFELEAFEKQQVQDHSNLFPIS